METAGIAVRNNLEHILYVIEQNAADADEIGQTSPESLQVLRESGLLGTFIPFSYGGLGKNVLEATRLIERLGSVDPSIAIIAFQHMSVISRILEWGTEEQKNKYLPLLASGEWLAASAWSEKGAGANKQNLGTIAQPLGNDKWKVSGEKTFTTGAGLADLYLVLVQTGENEADFLYGNSGQSFFLIETNTLGVSANSRLNLSGMRGSSTGFIEMNNCIVSPDALLGSVGQAPSIISHIRESGMSLGAVSVGISDRVLTLAKAHLIKRNLANNQIFHFKMSELSTLLEASRSLVERAASGNDELSGSLSYQSKVFASEVSEKICRDCQQIMGGGGYMRGQAIERLTRDARAVALMGPVNDLAKEITGREMMI
ncbi:acyl-CoA dehydrogenase family protein [Fictibacillus barbaricus]|uniref:Alkylation response protein AidB-like acyl-CoA dehydrogenase n=1 Tax=Fictibacillus barbaricus TaxID=182136 RepID=A0ABU1U408_9BACL|nr:acyl-CoA dehydrogenase family protein [Fictibacillus barbaricus]MDR7074212.1 alkylation response protein AidB-like acyl-CoA dehydrogenase [Fictibacillus barbaricus]